MAKVASLKLFSEGPSEFLSILLRSLSKHNFLFRLLLWSAIMLVPFFLLSVRLVIDFVSHFVLLLPKVVGGLRRDRRLVEVVQRISLMLSKLFSNFRISPGRWGMHFMICNLMVFGDWMSFDGLDRGGNGLILWHGLVEFRVVLWGLVFMLRRLPVLVLSFVSREVFDVVPRGCD